MLEGESDVCIFHKNNHMMDWVHGLLQKIGLISRKLHSSRNFKLTDYHYPNMKKAEIIPKTCVKITI
jgi:hypothetical protein